MKFIFRLIILVLLIGFVVIATGRWTVPLTPPEWEERLWRVKQAQLETKLSAYVDPDGDPRYLEVFGVPELTINIENSDKAKAAYYELNRLLQALLTSGGAGADKGFPFAPALYYSEHDAVPVQTHWFGAITINAEAVNAAQSENEIAFMLAHELAHVKHRDIARYNGGMTYVFHMLAMSDDKTLGKINPLLNTIVRRAPGQRSLSHSQEFRADRKALSTICEFYGSGAGAVSNLERYRDRYRDIATSPTHPAYAERISALTAAADEIGCTLDGEERAKPEELVRLLQIGRP